MCYGYTGKILHVDLTNRNIEIEEKDDGLYFDLTLVNKRQLIDQGVKGENIFDCEMCTCCDNQFFSYRREGKTTGRHLSLFMLM